ncbi:DNA polymerase III subunit chi [Anopheles sinensis]|uniref:DNA polymerase III subunit chi n=1 Tax=Anopheles sinensis TaxID=74873 RepID=A0A084W2S9_ANOSI|nr:DNA polymerase III subunit chi [Anopheles sinensis]
MTLFFVRSLVGDSFLSQPPPPPPRVKLGEGKKEKPKPTQPEDETPYTFFPVALPPRARNTRLNLEKEIPRASQGIGTAAEPIEPWPVVVNNGPNRVQHKRCANVARGPVAGRKSWSVWKVAFQPRSVPV